MKLDGELCRTAQGGEPRRLGEYRAGDILDFRIHSVESPFGDMQLSAHTLPAGDRFEDMWDEMEEIKAQRKQARHHSWHMRMPCSACGPFLQIVSSLHLHQLNVCSRCTADSLTFRLQSPSTQLLSFAVSEYTISFIGFNYACMCTYMVAC